MINEEEMSDRPIFEETFYALCARIRQRIRSGLSHPTARASPAGSSTEGNVESLSHVRLPKLNLPTFSGRYDEWFSFRDTFHNSQ